MLPEQINEAWEMRNAGMSWEKVAIQFGVTRNILRAAIDPGWLEKRRVKNRKNMERVRSSLAPGQRYSFAFQNRVDVPPEVIAEKELAFSVSPSLSQVFLGDPLPGRSALDRKLHHV